MLTAHLNIEGPWFSKINVEDMLIKMFKEYCPWPKEFSENGLKSPGLKQMGPVELTGMPSLSLFVYQWSFQ